METAVLHNCGTITFTEDFIGVQVALKIFEAFKLFEVVLCRKGFMEIQIKNPLF